MDTNPAVFIRDFYNAALALGGLIGFGALVYGAIMYSVAGGNSAAAHEARDQITQALLGLVLLFAAYLILATINPSLVEHLDLPKLEALAVPADTTTFADAHCVRDCEPLSGIPNVTCKPGVGCAADQVLVSRLRNCMAAAASAGRLGIAPKIRVTEGMPPTSAHEGNTHNNGCAIDATVSDVASPNCKDVWAAQNFLQSYCGVSVYNEYPQCGGHGSTFQTGSHLHISAPGC